MNNLNLGNLKNNRDEILKAEIGALLFNLGKTHVGFWAEKNGKIYYTIDKNLFKRNFGYEPFGRYKQYYQKNSGLNNTSVFEYELKKANDKLRNFISNNFVEFPFNVEDTKNKIKWNSFFKGDAVEDSEEGKGFIQKIFFRGCENINSGIDKGSPKEENKLSSLWISNAFGSFKRDVEEKYFDETRLCFFNSFHRYLEDNSYYSTPDWQKIRDWVLGEVKSWYLRLLSDSRFPLNDVILFDQAYMTASMFKAVFAGLFLEPSKYSNYLNNPQSIKWSILGVQYDKLGLAEKGLKVASIKWYRDKSEETDNQIKKLIEIEYALGNEVYRDETGIYFVVAENVIGNKDGDFYKLNEALNDNLKKRIQDIFSNNFEGEIYPAIFLTEPSRGLMNLGHLIEKAKENFLKAEYKRLPYVTLEEIEFPEEEEKKEKYYVHPEKNFVNEDDENNKKPNTSIGICPICKMRLVFRSDLDKRNDPPICETCHKRFHHAQVRDWLRNAKGETIWLDELQDKNGRIALVTLKFELGKWLNGDLVNSLVVQNFNLNDKNYNYYCDDVLDGIKNNRKINDTILKDYHTNIPNLSLKNLIEKWFLERSIGSKWEEFIINSLSNTSLINFEKRTVNWNGFSENDYKFVTAIFLQFLIRKNPSPARLRRIWETTREFFENLESKLMDNKLIILPEERRKRIVITLRDGSRYKDKEYKYGELLFWKNGNELRTITSIEKVANYIGKELKIFGKSNLNEREENDIKDWLTNKIKKIESYNKNENDTIEFDAENVGNIQIENYKPSFTVLKPTPISWQFIIPAENLPQLIENVQKEYYKNFRWVYGKLPLHMGIIVQNYKKPLYVGIKALRKIRRDGIEWDKLGKEIPAKDFKARQKEVFHYQVTPENTEDCENFYSLFEKIENEGKYEFYLYPEKRKKVWLDTTQGVADTDKFRIYPNTIDFEFLDTNTRRNDIYYNDETGKRYLKTRLMRPYDLNDWQYFEKFKEFFFQDKKSSSKLQKLISLIYSKTEDWYDSESLKQFMISAFVNVLELKDDKNEFAGILGVNEFDELQNINAEVFKEKLFMLIDMFDFWHTMLKDGN